MSYFYTYNPDITSNTEFNKTLGILDDMAQLDQKQLELDAEAAPSYYASMLGIQPTAYDKYGFPKTSGGGGGGGQSSQPFPTSPYDMGGMGMGTQMGQMGYINPTTGEPVIAPAMAAQQGVTPGAVPTTAGGVGATVKGLATNPLAVGAAGLVGWRAMRGARGGGGLAGAARSLPGARTLGRLTGGAGLRGAASILPGAPAPYTALGGNVRPTVGMGPGGQFAALPKPSGVATRVPQGWVNPATGKAAIGPMLGRAALGYGIADIAQPGIEAVIPGTNTPLEQAGQGAAYGAGIGQTFGPVGAGVGAGVGGAVGYGTSQPISRAVGGDMSGTERNALLGFAAVNPATAGLVAAGEGISKGVDFIFGGGDDKSPKQETQQLFRETNLYPADKMRLQQLRDQLRSQQIPEDQIRSEIQAIIPQIQQERLMARQAVVAQEELLHQYDPVIYATAAQGIERANYLRDQASRMPEGYSEIAAQYADSVEANSIGYAQATRDQLMQIPYQQSGISPQALESQEVGILDRTAFGTETHPQNIQTQDSLMQIAEAAGPRPDRLAPAQRTAVSQLQAPLPNKPAPPIARLSPKQRTALGAPLPKKKKGKRK